MIKTDRNGEKYSGNMLVSYKNHRIVSEINSILLEKQGKQ